MNQNVDLGRAKLIWTTEYIYLRIGTNRHHCPRARSLSGCRLSPGDPAAGRRSMQLAKRITPHDVAPRNMPKSRVHVSNRANAAGKDTLIRIGWLNPSSSVAVYTIATDLVESATTASPPNGTDQCIRTTTAATK